MEGVGARYGRSSTRYGPPTVFTGPVRKWKKKWVHVPPSTTGTTTTTNNNHSSNNDTNNNHHHSTNGTSNGNNGSHLLLFKWTPLSQSQNNIDDVAAPQEPPRRKFKYIPIAVLEEQESDETAENIDDEVKPSEADPSAAEPTSRNDDFDGKPDINDTPMDESQEDTKIGRQDLNESTLDLSLG
ncbi:hypothetical protein V6N13_023250 [Hibiscus sabdariffa]|uniref:Uncharacterized protein n=2 Tax=Hibiscus sabdariffa TaxID=183260 RepID=A0ABR2B552_9ROSI